MTVHFAANSTLPHWHIVIPGSPMRVNACWEPHRRGSRATIGKTKEYRAHQAWLQSSGICLGVAQIDVPVIARVDAYFARRSRKYSTADLDVPDADVDACVKPLLDSLEHVGVLLDDKLVMRCDLHKHLDRDDPRVEVRGVAMDYVIFASYGNDSIALIQWMHEHGHNDAAVAYSDTGWAAPWWIDRVSDGEALAESYGMETVRIGSMGFVPLARLKKAFPRNGMQFCTLELKIKPALAWLDSVDPDGDLTCCVGVRREESRSRQRWPEYTEESKGHGGRSLWAPMVRVEEPERDALITRAGFDVLPHRSQECYPCINANRSDIRLLSDERVDEIEAIEGSMGVTGKGKMRTLFRPYRHQGAVGIREVKRWADAERGQYGADDEQLDLFCDGGWCGT